MSLLFYTRSHEYGHLQNELDIDFHALGGDELNYETDIQKREHSGFCSSMSLSEIIQQNL